MCRLGFSVGAALILIAGAVSSAAVAQEKQSASSISPHVEGTESFEGACPMLSPSGRLVAMRRYVPLPRPFVGSFRFTNAAPMREDLWIRDLITGEERRRICWPCVKVNGSW